MAEALGLATSILAIAGAATKLSIGLYEIAVAVKDAAPEIRIIANDTSLFSRVLREVSHVLDGNSAIAWRARSIAEDLVQVCQTTQQNGERLLCALQPLIHQTGSKRQRVILRIRWLFQRSSLLRHREALHSLKINLQLLIAVMQMTRETNEEAYTGLSYDVQSLKYAVESSIQMMQRSLQSPNTVHTLLQQIPEGIIDSHDPQCDTNGDSLSEPVPSELISDDSFAENPLQIQVSSSNTQSSLATLLGDQDAQNNAEHEGLLALTPYFRLIFVQEKVSTLATAALEMSKQALKVSEDTVQQSDLADRRKSSTKSSTNVISSVSYGLSECLSSASASKASAQSVDGYKETTRPSISKVSSTNSIDDRETNNTVDSQAGDGESRPSTGKTKIKRKSHLPDMPESFSDDEDVASTISVDSEKSIEKPSSSRRSNELKKEADNLIRKANKDSRRLAKEMNKQEQVKKKQDLVKKSMGIEEKLLRDKESGKKDSVIYFKDAIGRKYSFPWHMCQKWKGMEDLICQAFVHVDVIGQRVQNGYYDILGPHGEIILPQVWETVVEPDMSITMSMWPMDEPEAPTSKAPDNSTLKKQEKSKSNTKNTAVRGPASSKDPPSLVLDLDEYSSSNVISSESAYRDVIWVRTFNDQHKAIELKECSTYDKLLGTVSDNIPIFFNPNSEYWINRINRCVYYGKIRIFKGDYGGLEIPETAWLRDVRPDLTIAIGFTDEEIDQKFGSGRGKIVKRSSRLKLASWLSRRSSTVSERI